MPKKAEDSFVDSIRIRGALGLERRPDTLGARVDLTRILGSATAPVWLVIVSEFQCESCRRLATDILPTIRREYVDPGKVRVAFVNWPDEAHFNSRFASHAALCAGSAERFWEMHDSLFASLPRWERLADPQPFMDSLAITAGVAPDMQHSCTSRSRVSNLLKGDLERSELSGATIRPTLFVGNQKLEGDGLTLFAVRRALDIALSRAGATHD
ncbi:MAG: thioredoxin domain-containing protein [Gemmatimonadota bacterium]